MRVPPTGRSDVADASGSERSGRGRGAGPRTLAGFQDTRDGNIKLAEAVGDVRHVAAGRRAMASAARLARLPAADSKEGRAADVIPGRLVEPVRSLFSPVNAT